MAECLVERDGHVLIVTMNRPEARNALNRAIRTRLPRVILDLEARADVDVVILTGTDPAFCAGVDLKEFGAGGAAGAPTVDDGDGLDMGRRDADGRLPFRGPLPPRTKLLIGALDENAAVPRYTGRNTKLGV